ncbi:MAG: hypothetical protein FH749_09685 [Firmicutes bacterium]|nr:hypothetical protein [Bacillota bacterium]
MKWPQRRSPLWFIAGAVLALAVAVIFVLFYGVIFNHNLGNLNLCGIVLIFFLLFQLIALAGFWGRRILVVCATLGIISGLILFLSVIARNVGGFEGLVGALSMLMLIAAGFALGLILELAHFLWLQVKRKHK